MRYFLIFTGDSGDREDCNVYYSRLVIATDEVDALHKYQTAAKLHASDMTRYEALEMKPIK